jgi:hypothetical protein
MRIEWLTYAPTLFKLRIEMTTIFLYYNLRGEDGATPQKVAPSAK